MHGHQPDAVAAFFKNRRLGGLGRQRRVPQLVDEAAERDAASSFVLARQFGDVKHVGQRLLAGGPQDETDMRARLLEKRANRVGDRTVVPSPVQLLQKPQRVGDRHEVPDRVAAQRQLLAGVSAKLRRHTKRMECPPESRAEFEEVLVVDREQRAFQRREHRQFVVRPFDGRERRADRLHFLAPVKRLPADEQMRDATRLDGLHVLAGQVFTEAHEPAEQDRDVPWLEGHARFRSGALGHRPPAFGIGDRRNQGRNRFR